MPIGIFVRHNVEIDSCKPLNIVHQLRGTFLVPTPYSLVRSDEMQWIERLNEALLYIEDNLEGSISYEKAGQLANCSTYHF